MDTEARQEKVPLREPDAHVISRRLHRGVQLLLVLVTVLTLVLFLFYRPAAYLAAIPIPILIIASAVVNQMERRSRAGRLRVEGQTHISKEELETDLAAAGLSTALKVGLALALGTFIVAAAAFDLATLGIGAAALLLLAILIEIPYLGLFVTESQRDELEKVRPKTHAAHPSNSTPTSQRSASL